jgi:hypothetical protein
MKGKHWLGVIAVVAVAIVVAEKTGIAKKIKL